MKKTLLSLLLLISVQVLTAQQKPRIIILATGASLAGSTASDKMAYTAGKIPLSDLIGAIPAAKDIADISGEQIASVGSQDITIELWRKIANRINEIFTKDQADAVVLTHGTDTQEETAYFLSLVVTSKKPVVLTGAMRPSTAVSADGPKNLYDAITVAADLKSKDHGVLISFNESIYTPRDVTKISTTKVNGFAAPNSGPIGQVNDGKVEYFKTADHGAVSAAPFKIEANTKIPKVEIVYMYADASPLYLNQLIREKVQGIVIAGVGNGNFSKTFSESVKKAVAAGIVVCRASRCVSGRVIPDVDVNDKTLGTIVSDDLNPQKARILLMLGLIKTKNKVQLQEFFRIY